MTNRGRMGLSGPVQSVLTEMFEFVREGERFTERPWYQTATTFNRDGTTASHISNNPDGSVSRSRFEYDDAGRLRQLRYQVDDQDPVVTVNEYDGAGRLILVDTGGPGSRSIRYETDGRRIESQLVPWQPGTLFAFGIEGARGSFSCDGAHEVTTVFDTTGRADEMLFCDHDGRLLSRVAFTWDAGGRLIEEVQYLGDVSAIDLPAGVEIGDSDRAALERVFGARTEQSRRVNTYDARDRCIESLLYLTKKLHDRETLRYDDNGAVAEQARYDDAGVLTHQIRYERECDGHGNWTVERVMSRTSETEAFVPASVSRRKIAYFAG